MPTFETFDAKVARRCRYDQHRGQKTTVTVEGSLAIGLHRLNADVLKRSLMVPWALRLPKSGEQLREQRSIPSGFSRVGMPPRQCKAEHAPGVHQHAAKTGEIKRDEVLLPKRDQQACGACCNDPSKSHWSPSIIRQHPRLWCTSNRSSAGQDCSLQRSSPVLRLPNDKMAADWGSRSGSCAIGPTVTITDLLWKCRKCRVISNQVLSLLTTIVAIPTANREIALLNWNASSTVGLVPSEKDIITWVCTSQYWIAPR
jgi:hypothetical protein